MFLDLKWLLVRGLAMAGEQVMKGSWLLDRHWGTYVFSREWE